MMEKNLDQVKNSSLKNVRLLSAIFPITETTDQFSAEVDQVLEILCDAKIPFELLLISSSESIIQEDRFLDLGRKYPQVHPVLCPGIGQGKAVSMAIRRAGGDLIVVLDQGPKATTQLLNLLQDLIERTTEWSNQSNPSFSASPDQLKNAYQLQKLPIEGSAGNDPSSLPDPGPIEDGVIERLDRWAKAIVAERNEKSQPAAEIPQNRPFEKEAKPAGDEIRRVDSQPSGNGKKRLPKFITHFHEFI